MDKEYLKFFPKEHIEEILIRLNSNDRHISQSAYFEVFCYNFFYNKGFRIDLHPIMENNKRPDFKVYNDKISFYLEAIVIAEEKYKKVESAQNKVISYLKENLTDFKYYIFLSFSIINIDIELRKKRLKEFILNIAENLNDTNYSGKIYEFEDNGWIIDISFFAKTDEYSEDIISSISPGYSSKDDYRYVKKSLKKKASKYGELELPYILATCYYVGNIFLNEGDLINALLGNRVYMPELRKIFRQKNGLWYSDRNCCNNSNNKTLSGVLYFNVLKYNNNSKPKLFKNPWAKNPITLEEVGIENIDAEIKYVKG